MPDLKDLQLKTPKEIYDWVRTNVRYDPFSGTISTPAEVAGQRKGNDVEQAMLIDYLLSKIEPKIKHGCMLGIDSSNKKKFNLRLARKHHAFAYFATSDGDDKYYWIETTYSRYAGIHGPYSSVGEMKKDFKKKWALDASNSINKYIFWFAFKKMSGMSMAEFLRKQTESKAPGGLLEWYDTDLDDAEYLTEDLRITEKPEFDQHYDVEFIKRIPDVASVMDGISYGFIGKDGKIYDDREWIHSCPNLSRYYSYEYDPEKTIERKMGLCFDQSLAIKHLLAKLHPDCECTIYALRKGRFGHAVPGICSDGKWYYYENAWDKEKGVHGPFSDEDALKKFLYDVYHYRHDADNDDEVTVGEFIYDKSLNESMIA